MCTDENRKTLSGNDVINAFNKLGLENYSKVLGIYLKHYKDAKSKQLAPRLSPWSLSEMEPAPVQGLP